MIFAHATNPEPRPTAASEQTLRLSSVAASIDLAMFQIREGRTASALEILSEAIREANGDSLELH